MDRAPTIVHASPCHVSAIGGAVLTITGNDFNYDPPTAVSVWLSRGVTPGYPWTTFLRRGGSGIDAEHGLLSCSLRLKAGGNGVQWNSTYLTCVLPAGLGTGWRVVVVNHDVDDGSGDVSTTQWQQSTSADFVVDYLPPSIASVVVSGEVDSVTGIANTRSRPCVGGFSVVITGANFGPIAPAVTIGGLPCVVVAGSSSDGRVVCTAPQRATDADSDASIAVVVWQDGQSSEGVPFAYDGPSVMGVTPSEFPALDVGRTVFTVTGVNFGVPAAVGSDEQHVVTVGPFNCTSVVWPSDSLLTCVVAGEVPVGAYPVVVTVPTVRSFAADSESSVGNGNDSAVAGALVTAVCPSGYHGTIGQRCEACPVGAVCAGGVGDPIAASGYYPLSRTQFVECSPVDACDGGTNYSAIASAGGSLSCSRNYIGDRCALCAPGSYRLNSTCHTCPNTAWLLFLLFSLAILTSVATAVYLSKKKINFAGLSIGVVSCGNWFRE